MHNSNNRLVDKFRQKVSWLCHVLSGLAMGLLLGCTAASPVPQASASHPVTPPAAQTTPSPTATLMVIESPTWALYQEPHHYFSLEYPSGWRIKPGEPPLSDSPFWGFSGLLVTRPVTQVIEIARDTIPIHPSQTIEAWNTSKGPGEAETTIIEQRTFQLNGREAYFVKAGGVSQRIGQTTYVRCGTWVWIVTSGIQDTIAKAEFDVIYDHVVNTFTPKCN